MSATASGPTRVISVTSGKGGVGKTTLVSNMAVRLGQQGRRVLLLDGDLGMANLDIMFNVRPEGTIHDVIEGRMELKDVILRATRNVDLIPGGSGIFELQELSPSSKMALLDQVGDLGTDYDIMLIDTAPGIADHVLYLNSAAQEILVVVTPDAASITDSYALIKVLNQRYRESQFGIVCNQVQDESEGLQLYGRLAQVTDRFLQVRLDYVGCVVADPILRQCAKERQLLLNLAPDSAPATAISRMAARLNGFDTKEDFKGGLQFFWRQMIGAA